MPDGQQRGRGKKDSQKISIKVAQAASVRHQSISAHLLPCHLAELYRRRTIHFSEVPKLTAILFRPSSCMSLRYSIQAEI